MPGHHQVHPEVTADPGQYQGHRTHKSNVEGHRPTHHPPDNLAMSHRKSATGLVHPFKRDRPQSDSLSPPPQQRRLRSPSTSPRRKRSSSRSMSRSPELPPQRSTSQMPLRQMKHRSWSRSPNRVGKRSSPPRPSHMMKPRSRSYSVSSPSPSPPKRFMSTDVLEGVYGSNIPDYFEHQLPTAGQFNVDEKKWRYLLEKSVGSTTYSSTSCHLQCKYQVYIHKFDTKW